MDNNIDVMLPNILELDVMADFCYDDLMNSDINTITENELALQVNLKDSNRNSPGSEIIFDSNIFTNYIPDLTSIDNQAVNYDHEFLTTNETINVSYIDFPQTDVTASEISCSSPSSTVLKTSPSTVLKKKSRRRKTAKQKEKLYMVEEPFSDNEMEIKRKNAIKAYNNRMKNTEILHSKNRQIEILTKDVQEKATTIINLQNIIKTMEERELHNSQHLIKVKSELNKIILN